MADSSKKVADAREKERELDLTVDFSQKSLVHHRASSPSSSPSPMFFAISAWLAATAMQFPAIFKTVKASEFLFAVIFAKC